MEGGQVGLEKFALEAIHAEFRLHADEFGVPGDDYDKEAIRSFDETLIGGYLRAREDGHFCIRVRDVLLNEADTLEGRVEVVRFLSQELLGEPRFSQFHKLSGLDFLWDAFALASPCRAGAKGGGGVKPGSSAKAKNREMRKMLERLRENPEAVAGDVTMAQLHALCSSMVSSFGANGKSGYVKLVERQLDYELGELSFAEWDASDEQLTYHAFEQKKYAMLFKEAKEWLYDFGYSANLEVAYGRHESLNAKRKNVPIELVSAYLSRDPYPVIELRREAAYALYASMKHDDAYQECLVPLAFDPDLGTGLYLYGNANDNGENALIDTTVSGIAAPNLYCRPVVVFEFGERNPRRASALTITAGEPWGIDDAFNLLRYDMDMDEEFFDALKGRNSNEPENCPSIYKKYFSSEGETAGSRHGDINSDRDLMLEAR